MKNNGIKFLKWLNLKISTKKKKLTKIISAKVQNGHGDDKKSRNAKTVATICFLGKVPCINTNNVMSSL